MFYYYNQGLCVICVLLMLMIYSGRQPTFAGRHKQDSQHFGHRPLLSLLRAAEKQADSMCADYCGCAIYKH